MLGARRIAAVTAVCAAAAIGALVPAASAKAVAPIEVVVYTHVGSPLVATEIRAYGPRGVQLGRTGTSDRHGFEILRIPAGVTRVRIVTSGGTLDGKPFSGALRAVVDHPVDGTVAHLNTVTTVATRWLSRNPAASIETATAKARLVLGLHPTANVGRFLTHGGGSFDGATFMRSAAREGGFTALTERAVRRIASGKPPLRFRAPSASAPGRRLASANRGSGATAASSPASASRAKVDVAASLSLMSNAVSVVAGAGNIVNNIIGWANGPQASTGQVYSVVQRLESQVGAIEGQVSLLESQVADIESQLAALNLKVDQAAFSAAQANAQALMGAIDQANTAFSTIVNNATHTDPSGAPAFSATAYANARKSLDSAMSSIEPGYQRSNRVFHDALIGSGSAYQWLSTSLRDLMTPFITPAYTAALQAFAGKLLNYQAMGFSLISRYGASVECDATPTCSPPPSILSPYADMLLGSLDQATAWAASPSPSSSPPSGDLHDEVAMLQSITAVPPGTVIDSRTGLMIQSYSRSAVAFPATNTCNATVVSSSPFTLRCNELQSFLVGVNLQNALDATSLQDSTGVGGWVPISTAQATALFAGQANPQHWTYVQSGTAFLLPNYVWLTDQMTDVYGGYTVSPDSSGPGGTLPATALCDYANLDPYRRPSDPSFATCYIRGQAYPGRLVIDAEQFTFIDALTGASVSCWAHAGGSTFATSCGAWFLYVRQPAASEKYWQ